MQGCVPGFFCRIAALQSRVRAKGAPQAKGNAPLFSSLLRLWRAAVPGFCLGRLPTALAFERRAKLVTLLPAGGTNNHMKTENRLSSAVSDIGSEAAERFDEVQSSVTETVARISRDTGKFIRERPWTAVAIVAAVGIAIGLMAKSRD